MNGFKIVLQKPFLNPSKVFKRFRIGFFLTVFKKTCLKPLPGLWGKMAGGLSGDSDFSSEKKIGGKIRNT